MHKTMSIGSLGLKMILPRLGPTFLYPVDCSPSHDVSQRPFPAPWRADLTWMFIFVGLQSKAAFGDQSQVMILNFLGSFRYKTSPPTL